MWYIFKLWGSSNIFDSLNICSILNYRVCANLGCNLNLFQGGIFPGNQGARFPRNLQTHTKFLQQFTLFWCEFLVTGRNFLSEAEMSYHKKKFLAFRRNFLSKKETFSPNYRYFERSCRIWLPLFRAKFSAESIGSHEVKYFIPPWSRPWYLANIWSDPGQIRRTVTSWWKAC